MTALKDTFDSCKNRSGVPAELQAGRGAPRRRMLPRGAWSWEAVALLLPVLQKTGNHCSSGHPPSHTLCFFRGPSPSDLASMHGLVALRSPEAFAFLCDELSRSIQRKAIGRCAAVGVHLAPQQVDSWLCPPVTDCYRLAVLSAQLIPWSAAA